MGFYVRKSLRAGPFRVSLSNAGVGVSAGIPGFRISSSPRGNYVRVGTSGIYYQATFGSRGQATTPRTDLTPYVPLSPPSSEVAMQDVTGADAETLAPTGPGDLVEQLNQASSRHRWWPWLAVVAILSMGLSPYLLLLTVPAVVWLALWERPRRTVLAFYEVSGPTGDWFDRLTTGFPALSALAGAWRIQASGAVTGTYQYKVNSGASSLVQRAAVAFTLRPPRTLTTNISVPSIVSGKDALLFLPDRVLLRSGRRWSDVPYAALTVTSTPTLFIESGRVPRDAHQVDTTWQYVNVKGGPDRRFKNNPRLPVLRYGRLEFSSPAGLRWIIDCSRADTAAWAATNLSGPPAQPRSRSPRPTTTRPSTQPTTRVSSPPTTRARRSAAYPPPAPRRAERTPVAPPGLFSYADLLGAAPGLTQHHGPYAVIDVETTGFSAAGGDRVIEIAIARTDGNGRIEDEYATLINPDGHDTGPVFVHGISNDAVRHAPRFADILGEVISRIDGCVVVAHNAAFEERFLAAEFERAGFAIRQLPALCTLWLAQHTLATPNYKLGTLVRHAGIALPDAHTALGDVRAVTALLPTMLDRQSTGLGYPCPPWSGPFAVPSSASPSRPVTRAVALRHGKDGWMTSIVSRLPLSASEAGDADAEAYTSLLARALEDGRIVGAEARQLAALAGAAGLGASQVAALNRRFLEAIREAAWEDGILTPAELASLRNAAKLLGAPDYFADLTATVEGSLSAAPQGTPVARQRRCGHCRTPGHNRSTCPELTRLDKGLPYP